MGRASLTTIFLPKNSKSFNYSLALCAASTVSIVTKAKPLDLSVNLSLTIKISVTVPCDEKSEFNSSSLALKDRFPTYNFVLMYISG